ncbi:hypothetical protein V2P20_09080 [Methylobacter sp. Wu1]|uniref:hypothetical protein n=1 Tax=Methylobacter sp. Wu1 TaxID=3119359 RepID=UPI002F93FA10
MEDEATVTGAESTVITETAPDPDESLINAITATDDDLTDSAHESETPPADLYTVKINGEEKQVTRDELIANYQKEQAAAKRFEEAAQIRKEAETQREQYTQHQQLLSKAVERLESQIQLFANEGQPDWQNLLENNPHEYLKQQEIFKQRQTAMYEAQQAKAYLQQQQAHEQQQQLQQHLAKESERLINDLIPEWKNQEVRQKDEQELISYLKDSGYSDQDLINLSHSRADNIVLARKAMLYDLALKKANSLKKQTPTAANPVPTVGNKAASQGKKTIFDPNLSDAEYDRMRREQRRKLG